METRILIGSAVSGGSLRELLEEAASACGTERLVLGLERIAMDFPLPCPSGIGTPLTRAELESLRRGAAVFFSEPLCAKYFVCRRGGKPHFILFDDDETLRRKQALARTLGIGDCFLLYPYSP
jgi:hypothetical protein